MTDQPPVRQQTIRIEQGQLHTAGGVFQVSRIDGTQVMDRWYRPAGPGCVFMALGLACALAAVAFALTGFVVVTADPGTPEWIGQMIGMAIFVGPCAVGAIVFFVAHVRAQPRTAYWHELEIWVSGTRHVIAAWQVEPLWAIQNEIAAAQRDAGYVGQPIFIGQVNTVSGKNNAANFGGHGNSAQTGGS
ncbi:hypothetical protein [Myceligenerans indicum]|uniref:Uncharacterized protein n=1 Tax=Myceligenerans indicum TaxID=2593663 RepID=A0ABS1LQK4_9MICO|nr:hypothetical protein [Myceligenerans indicum]MBL0888279.1 hypothetical protein [Myceligenerans indicum]